MSKDARLEVMPIITVPTLFSRAVGGGAAVVGIIWLVPARRGWLRLWQVLLAYGFAARLPVAIVILLGILNGWNTHYDSPPPGLPELSPFARWIAIGLIPQFTIWIAVTVILGILAGAASLALVPPRGVPAPAGS